VSCEPAEVLSKLRCRHNDPCLAVIVDNELSSGGGEVREEGSICTTTFEDTLVCRRLNNSEDKVGCG
jgi:hypothetical protein